jgi:hypothetical protein
VLDTERRADCIKASTASVCNSEKPDAGPLSEDAGDCVDEISAV